MPGCRRSSRAPVTVAMRGCQGVRDRQSTRAERDDMRTWAWVSGANWRHGVASSRLRRGPDEPRR
jgi:hypothetical protein